jgi:hypothetical protein
MPHIGPLLTYGIQRDKQMIEDRWMVLFRIAAQHRQLAGHSLVGLIS